MVKCSRMFTMAELEAFSRLLVTDRRCGDTALHLPHWHADKWCDGKNQPDMRVR